MSKTLFENCAESAMSRHTASSPCTPLDVLETLCPGDLIVRRCVLNEWYSKRFLFRWHLSSDMYQRELHRINTELGTP